MILSSGYEVRVGQVYKRPTGGHGMVVEVDETTNRIRLAACHRHHEGRGVVVWAKFVGRKVQVSTKANLERAELVHDPA